MKWNDMKWYGLKLNDIKYVKLLMIVSLLVVDEK